MSRLQPVRKIIASPRASLCFSMMKSTGGQKNQPKAAAKPVAAARRETHTERNERSTRRAADRPGQAVVRALPWRRFRWVLGSQELGRSQSSAPGVPLTRGTEGDGLARVGRQGRFHFGLPKIYHAHRQGETALRLSSLSAVPKGTCLF